MLIILLFVVSCIYCNKDDASKTTTIFDLPYIKLGEFNKNSTVWYNGFVSFEHNENVKCIFMYMEGSKKLSEEQTILKNVGIGIYFNGHMDVEDSKVFRILFGCVGIKDVSIYKNELYIYEVKTLHDLVNHKKLENGFKYKYKYRKSKF